MTSKSTIGVVARPLKILVLSGVMVLGAGGCGSGGGSSSTTATAPTTTPTTVSANGIWRGTVTNSSVGYTSNDVVGLAFNGQLYFFDPNSGEMDTGAYTLSGNQMTANVTAYVDGVAGAVATGTITATVQSAASVSGTYTNSLGQSGTVNLTYDSLYDRSVSLADTQDVWMYTDGAYTITISANGDGSFTGSDTDGCTYTGSLVLAEPGKNLYATGLNVANCGVENGTYSGYGALNDTSGVNDTLTFALQNPNYIIYIDFMRQ